MTKSDEATPSTPSLDTRSPFTRAEARAAGIACAALAGPRFKKLFYDLYVEAAVEATAELRGRAILKTCATGSFLSHHTAAEFWGGCVPAQPLTHVTSPHGTWRCRRAGTMGHEVSSPPAAVVVRRGLRVSSPEQTFIDMAGELSLVDLVVLGDSLVHGGHTTPQKLVQAADEWTGQGLGLARRAGALVRAGVDSPMESRLRMLILLAGLPEPVVNMIIRDDQGNWVMRFDLSYPDLKLVIEYDGRQHAEDHRQWDRDIDRREDLDRAGWRVVIIRSKGIYDEPDRTLRRIIDALRECGATGLPRRMRPEWRAHFPGRQS